ncbi:hypothetical protein J8L88_18960 [Aquimarina sp. MMG015]|uniref:flavodoxin family protein n=1 Tax=Aquimarina TaxID=290174 RepID=UPI0003FE4CCC|nr:MULTISPECIES: hypothetical protein [Aquimarina]MBQ4804953.1 hypothetical protein [Aquimarina sp. MMG015]
MKRKKMNNLLLVIGLILAIWMTLSIVVRKKGAKRISFIGSSTNEYKALIIYDPDPIYNLDEKISRSFAKGLAENGWLSTLSTVTSTSEIKEKEQFDLYVFCSNTYNWAPDKAIKEYINNSNHLKEKKVVAITLGSGATKRSQRILEELIKKRGAKLMGSREFWLMKPNNESKSKRSNIKIAVEMANTFGKEIAKKIKN